jgi:hypothetical protein
MVAIFDGFIEFAHLFPQLALSGYDYQRRLRRLKTELLFPNLDKLICVHPRINFLQKIFGRPAFTSPPPGYIFEFS